MNDVSHHTHTLLRFALFAGLAALLVLALLLYSQYASLRREHLISGRMPTLTTLKENGTLEPQDASLIQSWMTFDYINYTFSLPSSYLQTSLSIHDPRYPHVAIEEYAEDAHLNLASTLTAIEAAVQSYPSTQ